MANYNTFDDFYETMLEAEPQTAYMGAVGSQTFGRSLPDPTCLLYTSDAADE